MPSPIPSPIQTLLTMLTYRRPAFSQTERDFIRDFLAPLAPRRDRARNLTVEIPLPSSGRSPILWSSHTDTVHRKPGRLSAPLRPDPHGYVWAPSGPEPLGADDTTGVWLMREMILAQIPGTYIFHSGEEIGGVGSQYIANRRRRALAHIQFAIAFDRAGTADIITHQFGGRTASQGFTHTLGEALRAAGLPGYRPSPNGTFTDTANYAEFIPECTNLSVGYYHQHTNDECQDLLHAEALRAALLSADFSTLIADRTPAPAQEDYWPYGLEWGRPFAKKPGTQG